MDPTQGINWQLTATDGISPTFERIAASATKMAGGDDAAFKSMVAGLQGAGVATGGLESAFNTLTSRYQTAMRGAQEYTAAIQRMEAEQTRLNAVLAQQTSLGMNSDPQVVVKSLESLAAMDAELKRLHGSVATVGADWKTAFGSDLDAATHGMLTLDQAVGTVMRNLQAMPASLERDALALKLGGTALRDLVNETGPLASSLSKVQAAMGETGKAADAMAQKTEKAGGLFEGFGKRMASTASGMLVYKAIGLVTEGVGALVKELLDAPAQMEQFQAVFEHLTGSVQAGTDRINEVSQVALVSPKTRQELLEADQLLLTYNIDIEKTGKGHKDLLTILSDVAAANKKVTVTQLADILNVSTSDPSRAIRRAREMGLMDEEALKQYGVKFDANNRLMGNSSQAVTKAMLGYWQNTFGGIGEAESHTWNGMKSNLEDLIQIVFSKLGAPLITRLEDTLSGWMKQINTPETMHTLEGWGENLGKVADLLGTAANWAGKLLGIFGEILKPVGDLLGGMAAMLPENTAIATSQAAINEQIAKGGRLAADAGGAQVAAAEDYAEEQAKIHAQLTDNSRLEQASGNLYKDRLNTLRDQGTELDRQYQLQNQTEDQAELEKKIAEDRLLAVDTYSSTGADARRRLVDEERQLHKLQRTMQHDADKQGLDDQKTNLELRQESGRRALEKQKRDLEDQLTAIADRERAAKKPQPDTDAKDKLFDNMFDHDLYVKSGDAVRAGINSAFDSKFDHDDKFKESMKAEAFNFLHALFGTDDQQRAEAQRIVRNIIAVGDNIPGTLARAARVSAGIDLAGPNGINQGPNGKDFGSGFGAMGNLVGGTIAGGIVATGQAEVSGARALGVPKWMLSSGAFLTAVTGNPAYEQYTDRVGGPGRADGGPVYSGQTYTVGERGPETLVMGGQGGHIIPNGGGGGGQNITVSATCPTCADKRALAYVLQNSDKVARSLANELR